MLNWNTSISYQDLHFIILPNTEGVKPNAYVDSVGKPTIGIGFNLTVPNVLSTVLNSMQIGVAFVPPALQSSEAGYVVAIAQAVALSYSPNANGAIQSALNAIMAGRALNSGGAISLSTFTMTTPRIQRTFNALAPHYEGLVNSRISGVPDSAERAVLFSLRSTPVEEDNNRGGT